LVTLLHSSVSSVVRRATRASVVFDDDTLPAANRPGAAFAALASLEEVQQPPLQQGLRLDQHDEPVNTSGSVSKAPLPMIFVRTASNTLSASAALQLLQFGFV
jgi:hypothetical protein